MAFEVSPIFIVQTIVGIIGMLGNALVCLVIWRDRAMHTLTNAFIFNQATVDFLGSVVMLLSSVIPTPSPLPPGAGGLLLCKIWVSNYFLWAFYVVSSFNLVALTFERYLAIVYPFKFQSMCTRLGATVVIISVWVAGFAVAIYATELYRFNVDRCDRYFDFKLQVIGIMVPGLQFFIPVASMLFAYIHIMVELKRSADRQGNMRTVSGPSNPAHESADESLLRARRNTFKTLFIVFVTFLICWSPSQFTFFLFNVGLIKIDYDGPLMVTSTILVASNCCINPIIYSFKYRQFRRALRKLIGRPEATEDAMITMSTAQTAISAVRVEKPS